MRKQLAAAGLTAGLAVGGIAGFAFASSTGIVGAQDGTTTAPAAPKGERPDRSSHIQDALKPLVDDGTITQAQADKVAEALAAAGPGRGDGGPGRGGYGGRGGFGFAGGAGLDAAADALGLTADELKTELKDGTSIKEIAEAKGVELSKVTDALVAAAKERIEQLVTDGKLTREQADQRIAQLSERITAIVNGERPVGGPDGRGPKGGWGHGPKGDAPAGDAPADAPSDTTITTEG